MLIHVGAGAFHLGILSNRLFKMELPVGGFRSLFQLGDFLKGLVCAILLVMLIVAQNSLTAISVLWAASTPEFSCSTSWSLP